MNKSNEEYALVKAEREIFLGFYSIRKLLDTFKLSPQTRKIKFRLSWSPCVGFVDYFNWHRIEELFDLEVVHEEERDIIFVCNQFIHSFIFIHVFSEDRALAGVYVSSDRDRTKRVYFISIEQILEAFRLVGKDYPKQRFMRRKKDGQWEEYTPSTAELAASKRALDELDELSSSTAKSKPCF
ncbi:hypothetical protein [Caballeronia sp. J97]|uniref:hypothetical protein n=1 Tax=Caballeronia sp. J97 TaxID=2805429 RepID=UPI002AB2938E|nr:hypothetical protein [Caballeronia sp. J97]